MEYCHICGSVIDATNCLTRLDCGHESCIACLTILKEQGQKCPSSSYCKAIPLRLILADGSRESKVAALDRMRSEVEEVIKQQLATDLRLTLELDQADSTLVRKLELAKTYDERLEKSLKGRAAQTITKYLDHQTIRERGWPSLEINFCADLLLHRIIRGCSPYNDNIIITTNRVFEDKDMSVHEKAALVFGNGASPFMLSKIRASKFIHKHSYIGLDQYLVDLGGYQVRWRNGVGWEYGKWPLPEYKYVFKINDYICSANGESHILLNFTPNPQRCKEECERIVRRHKEATDEIRERHKVDSEKLCFQLKCLEADIEFLDSQDGGDDSPSVAIYTPKPVKRLEFGKAKVRKHYADFMHSQGLWLFVVPKIIMVPLTQDVVMLRGEWSTVLHSCEIQGKQRIEGAKAVRISRQNIIAGYVTEDAFWFCERLDNNETWNGISILVATLGVPVSGDRPPEPIYPAVEGYANHFTIRHAPTREMLWVGLLESNGEPRVLGAISY